MNKFYYIILFASIFANAQISLVKDIFTGSSTAIPPVINSGNPSQFFDYNGTLLFRADDGTNGIELWKSDGTLAGTTLVKDINTAANANGNPSGFTLFGGNAFFTATTGTTVTGSELYKTDGTSAGTILVKDINPGVSSGNPSNFTVINPTTMLLSANNGTTGNELFKTDGTDAGTVNVLDYAGTTNSITWIENLNGTALAGYIANGAGRELYKSNGVTANSGLISELFAGTSSGVGTEYIKLGGQLFFQGNSGTTGLELWKTDGTTAGTALVKDINSGATASTPKRFAVLGNDVYFNAVGVNGSELWRSNGTDAGTTEVIDINPGAVGSNPDQVNTVNNAVYYFASDNNLNYDLYKYDGTVNTKLFDFNALTATVNTNFVSLNGIIYFAADSNADGKRELWQTTGTASSTVAVASLTPASVNAIGVNNITVSGGKIFFSAEVTDGIELYAYNPVVLDNQSFSLKNIAIYPNPTSGVIKVENTFDLNITYEICDFSGKILQHGPVLDNQVFMYGASGIYFLKIVSQNETVVKKVLKF